MFEYIQSRNIYHARGHSSDFSAITRCLWRWRQWWVKQFQHIYGYFKHFFISRKCLISHFYFDPEQQFDKLQHFIFHILLQQYVGHGHRCNPCWKRH